MVKKLLIIGGGNMGLAIASGMIKENVYDKTNIIFLEKNQDRIKFLKAQKYFVFNDIGEIQKNSKNLNTIIVAVKPNDLDETLAKLKDRNFMKTPIVSIAAGARLKKLSLLLSKNQPIARVMPNTPCQIGEGMSVITFNKNITNPQKKKIINIFKSLGRVLELKEDKFDLVTAVSGSGPAYFCFLIECLVNSATKLGINNKVAQELVLQTALGTVTLLSKNHLTPKTLRGYVTSPKGTTEAALKIFQENRFSDIIYSAIKAAKNRAAQLFFSLLLCSSSFLFLSFSHAQEPIQLGTESEDIALTDNVNIARAQVAKYPNNPEAHFNLAIALSRTSLVEEVIKELRQTKLLIRKAENKDLIEKKIIEYKEMIKNNPEANNIRYRLAFSYYLKAYLLAKNIEKLEKEKPQDSKKIKSKDVNLFSSQALSLADKNPLIRESLELSTFQFKELLSISPNDVWAKVYYAFILAEQFGEVTKAKGLWTDALKDDPNNPAPHFFLGELHIKEGDLKEGILELSQALLLRSQGH